MANPVSVPNPNFTAGTDAVAAHVNANFDALVQYINNNMVTRDGQEPIAGTQSVNNLIVSGTLTASGNLDVSGDITGDIVASNGTSIVLDNGTNGSDAWFRGDVRNAGGSTIVDVSTAQFNGNATTSSSTSGNAATATTLQTGRSIDITGVTATAQTFNGGSNISIPITEVPSTLLTGTINDGRISNNIARNANVYGYEGSVSGGKNITADSGTGAPSNSVGGNGDIYIRY